MMQGCLKRVRGAPGSENGGCGVLMVPDHIDLTKPVICFGRSRSNCDVVFSHPKLKHILSRIHATISWDHESKKWMLNDHTSCNGTFVNSTKVGSESKSLDDKDLVVFGDSGDSSNPLRFRFHVSCHCSEKQDSENLGADSSQTKSVKYEEKEKRAISLEPSSSSYSSSVSSSSLREACVSDSILTSGDECPNPSKGKRSRVSVENKYQEGDGESKFSSPVDWVMAHAKKLKRKSKGGNKSPTSADQKIPNAVKGRAIQVAHLMQKTDAQIPTLTKTEKCLLKPKKIIPVAKKLEVDQSADNEEKMSFKATLSKLGNEMTCSICTELFVRPTILSCGHTFCRKCISKWLRSSLKCPLCRCSLTRLPVDSHSIDQTISILLHDNPEGLKHLQKRREEDERELASLEHHRLKFMKLLSQARLEGYRLVHITNIWSNRERDRFLKGIKRYHGPVRSAYCASVSLSTELVARSDSESLSIIAYNLQLRRSDKSGPTVEETESDLDLHYYQTWANNHAANLRLRIVMFIHYV
mmetsp:Transcript_16693/g.18903  ORF Transcript_16693/g.18903 Transcript_16693/m.18903 type:complete len:527 (-) Transcript_16693:2752-4332(-)